MSKYTNWDQVSLMPGVKEAAEITGYGEARIRELARAGKIPYVRLGRA